MMDDAELLSQLFETVKQFTLSSGGDGDGWIVSARYKELADLFRVYEAQNGAWFVGRFEKDELVSFSRGQESIFFVKDRAQAPSSADIIVEIY